MSLYGEKKYSIRPSHLGEGMEGYRAKVEVIESLPPPISIKVVRIFWDMQIFIEGLLRIFLNFHIICAN